jgi:hypothetical protein
VAIRLSNEWPIDRPADQVLKSRCRVRSWIVFGLSISILSLGQNHFIPGLGQVRLVQFISAIGRQRKEPNRRHLDAGD